MRILRPERQFSSNTDSEGAILRPWTGRRGVHIIELAARQLACLIRHYGRGEVMDWCADNGLDCVFGLSGDKILAAACPQAELFRHLAGAVQPAGR